MNNASQPQQQQGNSGLAWKQPKTGGTVCVNPQSRCVRIQGKSRPVQVASRIYRHLWEGLLGWLYEDS